MTLRKKIFYLIIVSTCIRLLLAGFTEFGNDEVYYYTYALHLQWNYFDHPPGVALLIRLTTLNLLLKNELFVRLGAIACAAAGTWLSYKTGTLIKNETTGWYAAVLYNTSIYTSIIAGTFILPDSPQVVCWLAALLVLIKMILQLYNSNRIATGQWLQFALLSGVCILCKVHGIFLWIGLLIYLLFYNRKVFFDVRLYIAGFITILIFSPIIWWNINNHFVTWTYHSKRVAVHSFNIDINSFVQAFFGQLLYNNPVNVVLIAWSVWSSTTKTFLQKDVCRILLYTGLPIIGIVTLISLFNKVLPHWSGPGFLSLNFIAAAYLNELHPATTKLSTILKSSLVVILTAVTAGTMIINYYPGTIGNKNLKDYGHGDFTLDLYGWKNLAEQHQVWLRQQPGKNYTHLKLICNKWFPAAHIEYYMAQPTCNKVIGVGNLTDLHHFAWLNKTGGDLNKGDDALCIVPSNYAIDVTRTYKGVFTTMLKLHTFTVLRNGKTSRFFTLYYLKNYQSTDEVHRITIL